MVLILASGCASHGYVSMLAESGGLLFALSLGRGRRLSSRDGSV